MYREFPSLWDVLFTWEVVIAFVVALALSTILPPWATIFSGLALGAIAGRVVLTRKGF